MNRTHQRIYTRSIFYWIIPIVFCLFTHCQPKNTAQDRITDLGPPPEDSVSVSLPFDTQGHRGARGLLPENSIPAFLKAVDLGVRTLELDVVVSRDEHMVISHEPFFSHLICKDAYGNPIQEYAEKSFNIYHYTVEQIKGFDCGSMGNPNFPEQQKMDVRKPTLKEAIQTIEAYLDSMKLPKVFYNIETKSTPEGDSLYHPGPKKFARLLYEEVKALNILDRLYIQSFDVRTLQAFKDIDAEVPLVLLVYNELSLDENIAQLGFVPSVYSPYYVRVTQEELDLAHDQGMKVIPWTVNDLEEMKRLKTMGVDGIISDYPNLFKDLD